MRNMKNVFMLLFACVFCSCADEKKEVSINIGNDFYKEANLKLSDLVSSIEYIPLQTDTNCLVDNGFGVLLFANEIAVVNSQQCLLFDRKTGKFIKELLHRGRDPEGYNSTMVGNGLLGDESHEYVFFKEWNGNVSTYFYQTGERKRFPYSDYGAVAYLDHASFVGTGRNLDGKKATKMWFYKDYQCVDSIPNHEMFEVRSNAMAFFRNEDVFYRSGGNTYYKYLFNDTVYRVNAHSLTPVYWFEGDKLPQLEWREHPETAGVQVKKSYQVTQLAEDDTYILYTVNIDKESHHLIYHKKSGEGGVLKQDIVNDIDMRLNLWVDHITDKGEYVFIVNPAKLESEELEELQIQEDDNPVIVVGYRKE